MKCQPRLQVCRVLPGNHGATVTAGDLWSEGAIGDVQGQAETPLPGPQQKGRACGPAARGTIGIGLEGEGGEVGLRQRLRSRFVTESECERAENDGRQEQAKRMPHGQLAGSKVMVVTSPSGPEAPMGQKTARTLSAERKEEKLMSNLATSTS